MAWKRTLVTSALPYANGYIHLGHLAGAYLPADMYVRFLRLCGESVLYICGSDEHGVPILIAAEKEGKTPKEIADKYHFANLEAFRRFGMSFDYYGRTTDPVHYDTAQAFFRLLHQKGYLEEREVEQFYDPEAEMFLPDRYVEGTCPSCGYERARGDQCDRCGAYYDQLELKNPVSLVSGKPPIVRKTRHWYFKLSQFQEALEAYVERHSTDWKENVLQQVRSWLKQGLADRPVTRDLPWGVPVPLPEAKGKVLYVWFEAVLGYISATKRWAEAQQQPAMWQQWWQQEDTRYVAFIGKDNIVFHTLLFPAMLMAAGDYILPDNVPANEFLNLEGEKFSKSRNWSIDLRDYLRDFPEDEHVDMLRYALAANLPETRDSDFRWKDFQQRVNNELIAAFGNFVHRTLQFVRKNFQSQVPDFPARSQLAEVWNTAWEQRQIPAAASSVLNERERELLSTLLTQVAEIEAAYREFRFRDATAATLNVAKAANKFFNDAAPWVAVKTVPADAARALYVCVHLCAALSVVFAPITPYRCQKLRELLNLEGEPRWNTAFHFFLPPAHPCRKPELLFHKIEDAQIETQIAKLGQGATAVSETEKQVLVSYEEFAKLQFRIATIVEAVAIPKSKKLLKLQIDLGTERRQIVAGIAQHYEPEKLIGKQIVVIANLQPAKIMGVESQAMLLAAHTDSGEFALIVPEKPLPPGAVVK